MSAIESTTSEVPALREGYTTDFISGNPVRATPEEVDAVQVFARRLVEDFGYPKTHIRTRPQFTVRRSPSASGKAYPVDIAVFADPQMAEDQLQIVVECKKKNVREGRRQLELYMLMSHASLGVWFNGDQHLYLRKTYLPGGEVHFDTIPAIPRYGQRVEDIGRYKRSELTATQNLRAVFKDIRNHLAGNLTGITRDEALAQQIINVLFCKVYDEMDKGPDEFVEFRVGIDEDAETVHQRVLDLFAAVKNRYTDVFSRTDGIEIDPENLAYVVGELQNYSITESSRDSIGDAFEVFIGPSLKGAEGQFFTPRNVVRMMVEVLQPQPHERVMDPACGSGGFLLMALEYVWRQVEADGSRKKWDGQRTDTERRYVATQFFKGIEKDRFLAKVTKAYMAIVGDGRGGIFCDNSLLPPSSWDPVLRQDIPLGSIDVLLTNPPFGTRIPIKGKEVLSQYDLAHKFEKDRQDKSRHVRSSKVLASQSPQLLFIERCLQLLKPGGRMGIVLPESIFGMPTYTHVVQWLRERCEIVGIVSLPEEVFQPHTHAKVCAVFIRNVPPSNNPERPIFMSVVQWCGHDSRGNPTIRRHPDGTEELLDDLPGVAPAFWSNMGTDIWAGLP